MKTTIELPDPAIRQARALAADQGMTLKQFFTEALKEKTATFAPSDPPLTKQTLTGWPVSARCLIWQAKIAGCWTRSRRNLKLSRPCLFQERDHRSNNSLSIRLMRLLTIATFLALMT